MGIGNRLQYVYLLGLLALVPWPLYADDLLSIYQQAVQQAPQLQIARAQAQIGEAQAHLARSALLPSLALDTTLKSDPSSGPDSSTSNLILSQPLFNGQAWEGYQSAQQSQRAEQLSYQAARQALIVEVADKYFALLAAQHALSLAEAERHALQQQLQTVKQRFRIGMNTITELHETQARYDLTVADSLQAQADLDVAREQLIELTANEPTTLAAPPERMIPTGIEPDDIDYWTQQMQRHHPELAASRETVKAARSALSASKGAHLPSLELNLKQRLTDESGSNVETQSIELRFQLPLFSGGGTSATIEQQYARYMQAQARHQRLKQGLIRHVRQTFLQLKSHINRSIALQRALLSNDSALQATEEGLRVGSRTNVDVLNARRELLRARRNDARARYDYLIGTLELARAAGTLSETQLKAVNRRLE